MKHADTAYWDRFWRGPDVGLQWKHWAARDLVETGPVLDIGCGSGLMLELLRNKGLDGIVGCDISAKSTSLVAQRGLSALRCDVERPLPFASDSFATATLVDVLEHTFHPEELLGEAARVAREIVIVVPNFNSIVARLQVLSGRVPENNTPRKRHVYWFNHQNLKRLIASVGLELLSERFHTFKYESRLLAPPFEWLGRAFPAVAALAFAARLRRRT